MTILLTLLGYVAGNAALVVGLVSGVLWLVQPDPSLMREAKAAPIPPRIAESIERKKVPEPVAESLPHKSPMLEASVALTAQSAPKLKIRELGSPPAKKWKRKPLDDDRTLIVQAKNQSSSEVRASARNDSPY
jgi:hypothetical protein